MMRNIEFRKVKSNYFQDKLKKDINEILSSENLFVFADKSTNRNGRHKRNVRQRLHRLLSNNITSNYRKCENGVKHKIDKETKK